jgi:S-adenosylmethionine:tRNA ribosyltransferase-isomerase
MRTADFDYDLPSGLIAQEPVHPRDACRLMVVDRSSGRIEHRTFADLGQYLHSGDLLVVNDTKVLPARLRGVRAEGGGEIEVLLLRQRYTNAWECLVRPGRRLRPGAKVSLGEGRLTGLVVDVVEESGARVIQFQTGGRSLIDIVHEFGEMPLPPYITRAVSDPSDYQTVYAADERSAAAPTAGLHFTEEMLERLQASGVGLARVELDIGLDTFRPVSEEDPAMHRIHTERFRVGPAAADAVNRTRDGGRRVVAVGTTAVRAMESSFDPESDSLSPTEGDTSLFIVPGYNFRVVDALVTNFHLPRSTLLMLVSAFAGRKLVMHAYAEAIEARYRFFSFGDAMLIL